MKKKAFISLVIVLFVAVVVIYSMPKVKEDDKKPKPVTVVNDEANPVPISAQNPLPISGSVNVTGISDVNITNTSIPISGTLSVTQSGDWTVAISPTANYVQVDNQIDNPVLVRDVGNSVRQPLVRQYHFPQGGSETFSVPSGKRLVIEFICVDAVGDAGSFVVPNIHAQTNGVWNVFPIAVTATPVINACISSATHLVRIYVDPGTDVIIAVSPWGTVYGTTVILSGYLEDVS